MCQVTIELGPNTLAVLQQIAGLMPDGRTPPSSPRKTPDQQRHDRPATSTIQAEIAELKEMLQGLQQPSLEKEYYSVKEVAERTQREGVAKYKAFTIRQACNTGRIPEAKKSRTGTQWLIPRSVLDRILSEGLPTVSKE